MKTQRITYIVAGVILCLAVIALVAGLASCGDGDKGQVTATTAPVAATSPPVVSTPEPTTPEPVTKAQADRYARNALVVLKRGIVDQMSDTGKPDYECAPGTTDGTFDCEFTIRYRKLSKCGQIKVALTIGRLESGKVHSLPGQANSDEGQICFIGPDGEPVPDNPNE